MDSPWHVIASLAFVVTAVACLGTMLDHGGPRRAEPRMFESSGSLDIGADAGTRSVDPPWPGPPPDGGEARRAADLEPVTLRVAYANGERPRGVLLGHRHDGRKARPIVARNAGRSGVFRVELESGTHHLRWVRDAIALHPGDPLPLGEPAWAIDTHDPRTWDLTVPVAAQVLVPDPDRGTPELWRNGVRIAATWQEWTSSLGGPAHLGCQWFSGTRIALVQPGTYTIRGGNGESRTVVLTASTPWTFEPAGR